MSFEQTLMEYAPLLTVVVGVLLLGIGWTILQALLRLTMRLFVTGCAAIVVLGLFGIGLAFYLSVA